MSLSTSTAAEPPPPSLEENRFDAAWQIVVDQFSKSSSSGSESSCHGSPQGSSSSPSSSSVASSPPAALSWELKFLTLEHVGTTPIIEARLLLCLLCSRVRAPRSTNGKWCDASRAGRRRAPLLVGNSAPCVCKPLRVNFVNRQP
jgi:hypothetical protein